MSVIVGNCPLCGAPIYTVAVWGGVIPPPNTYTCGCRTPNVVTTVTNFEPFSSAAEDVDPEDVAAYVEYCRLINVTPDAFAFSIMFRTKYGHIPGRDIQRLLDAENTEVCK